VILSNDNITELAIERKDCAKVRLLFGRGTTAVAECENSQDLAAATKGGSAAVAVEPAMNDVLPGVLGRQSRVEADEGIPASWMRGMNFDRPDPAATTKRSGNSLLTWHGARHRFEEQDRICRSF
jgi:ribosomal protein S27E